MNACCRRGLKAPIVFALSVIAAYGGCVDEMVHRVTSSVRWDAAAMPESRYAVTVLMESG